jgi:dTDP-4-dehydrorhamnose reductase
LKVLVLGATGMIGSAVYNVLSQSSEYAVRGTVRSVDSVTLFNPEIREGLVPITDLEDVLEIECLLDRCGPSVVINCLSLGKPLPNDPMRMISMFAILPKRLSMLCGNRGIRFVQIGTDGVFSGKRGNYCETDLPDAIDVYGLSKLLGEPDGAHALTLRASIIGPELRGRAGLLEWFLSQGQRCAAYNRVIFSGLPTNVLAEIIRDHVLQRPGLHGTYHVAAPAISKFDLLRLISQRYGKRIELVPNSIVVSDRSLDASRFADATGYHPPDWHHLVDALHSYHLSITRK